MYILIILIGIITDLAFTPYNVTPLIVIGFLALFYLLLKSNNPNKAFTVGFLFGLGYFGFGNWWLFTIPDNAVAIVLFGVSVIALMALFYAVASAVSVYLYGIKKIYFLIFTPIVFTIAEKLRHSLWGGFSWLNPSDSLAYPLFHGLFATLGSLGVDFLIFSIASFIAYCFYTYSIKRAFVFTASLSTLLVALNITLNSVKYTLPISKKIKTLIMQDNFDNDAKESAYLVLDRVKKYSDLLKNLDKVELAIFPESTVSVKMYRLKYELKELFKSSKVEILFGGYIQQKGKTYNAVFDSKTLKAIYKKNHLIPFGEYMPNWASALKEYIPSFRMNNISSFKDNKNFKYKNIEIASSVCYEHLFDNELRDNFSKSNILLNISDLAWFNSSWVAPYMVSLAQVRAMEFAKPFVYSVNGGLSVYVLPNGKVEKVGLKKGRYLLYVNLQPYKGETLYAKYGDMLVAAISIIWLILVLLFKLLSKSLNDETSSKKY